MAVKCILSDVSKKHFKELFITDKSWGVIKQKFPECSYVGCPDPKAKVEKEHLTEMNKEHAGLHIIGNVVPACHKCNSKHRSKSRVDKISLLRDEVKDYIGNCGDTNGKMKKLNLKINLNAELENLYDKIKGAIDGCNDKIKEKK